jgi:hypothetical protein
MENRWVAAVAEEKECKKSMDHKQNKLFISRRKAIAGLLATGAGLSVSFGLCWLGQ